MAKKGRPPSKVPKVKVHIAIDEPLYHELEGLFRHQLSGALKPRAFSYWCNRLLAEHLDEIREENYDPRQN